MNRKVTVFGAGFVGSTTAQRIAEKQIADVVMVDIIEGMPQGKALDMMESACLEGFDAEITGSNDPAACAGSDLIVVTSGIARKPGMSRDDLLKTNAGIVGSVCDAIKKNAPNATVITGLHPQRRHPCPAISAIGTMTAWAVRTVAVIRRSDPPNCFTYRATAGRIGAFAPWNRTIARRSPRVPWSRQSTRYDTGVRSMVVKPATRRGSQEQVQIGR